MMRRCAIIILLAIANPFAFGGVTEVVAAARADAEKLPQEIAYQTLYLSLHGYPAEYREELRLVLSAHCNRLSREAVITKPREVTQELVAVNMADYQWDDKMVSGLLRNPEPYFHVLIETTQGAYTDQYGKQVAGKAVRANAAAPWVGGDYAALVKATKSSVPILRADWFIVQTSTQGNVATGYYDFLGLGNKEADFQKLIGADPLAAKRLKKEMAAVVARSGVTINNRSITRLQTITGAYWLTQDFKTSKDKQNTLRLLDGATVPPGGDASEQIGTLPNSLLAYWLQNANGERQNAAPPDIASDSLSHDNDRNVKSGGSCIRCHNGWKPIDDWARNFFQGNNKLVSPDYVKLLRLKQLYLSDLKGQIDEDQASYAKALRYANGLAPAADAKAFANVWARYEADMTIDDVARELDCSVELLAAGLKAQPLGDPVMMGLLPRAADDFVGPPNPGSILRNHYEEAVPLFYTMLGLGAKKP